MTIKDVVNILENIAPLRYQESYDNSGLIAGNPDARFVKALICLDSTEEVIDEAIALGCNLVIAHHPIVFGGLKKITGKNYVERTVIKAIRNDINIYACHTNLDSVQNGVSRKICEKIGLQNCRILAPQNGLLKKLSVVCHHEQAEALRLIWLNSGSIQRAIDAGFTYEQTVLSTGNGFSDNSSFDGDLVRIETVFAVHQEKDIMKALNNLPPGSVLNYTINTIENTHSRIGLGMIGEMPQALEETEFLKHLKSTMQTGCIRHTKLLGKQIKTVAVCGGTGFSLLPHAIAQKADVYVTADVKYHQFFDAEHHLILADIGHFESEQFTIELIKDLLTEKITNFAAVLTQINTNPVYYL